MDKTRLYDSKYFLDQFKGYKDKSQHKIYKICEEFFNNGAHPFYLIQLVRYVKIADKNENADNYSEFIAKKLSKHYKDYPIPDPSSKALGSTGSVSRLYNEDWTPRLNLDKGIFYGVIHEAFVEMMREVKRGGHEGLTWETDVNFVTTKLLEHPETTTHVLLSYVKYINLLGVSIYGKDAPVKSWFYPVKKVSAFIKSRLETVGVAETTQEVLQSWDEQELNFCWNNLGFIVSNLDSEDLQDPNPATTCLKKLLELADSKNIHIAEIARKVINVRPLFSTESTKTLELLIDKNIFNLLNKLKSELVNVETCHVTANYFKRLHFKLLRHLVYMFVYIPKPGTVDLYMDTNSEEFIQDLFGEAAWESLCKFQDLSFWQDYGTNNSGQFFRNYVKEDTQEYIIFKKALNDFLEAKSKPELAKFVEELMDSKFEESQIYSEVWRSRVNLLAGDTVQVVTHLRKEWMPLRRKKSEFLGEAFPKVSLCENPEFINNGAACTFRITIPNHEEAISGKLDMEGNLTHLDGIVWLSHRSKQIIRAVVVDSLAAILIPTYVEKLPVKSHGGWRVPSEQDFWARRPVIHTRGEFADEYEEPSDSMGTKIHPQVAQLLFEWLLDKQNDCPFRLYKVKEVQIGKGTESYYVTYETAKEDLLKAKSSIHDIYMRTTKAYTKPLGLYLNQRGDVVAQKVSARALRNYQMFVEDTGRELNFTPVRKTYTLPSGQNIVLDVPRTFCIGSFDTLSDCLKLVPDQNLKEEARLKLLHRPK